MSDVKYAVPAHNTPGLTTGSRIFGALTQAAPIVVAVAVQGFSNQGLVNHQVPVETVETKPSRIVEKKVAAFTEHFGVVDVPLTVTFDTAGDYTPLARKVQGREAHFPHVEREQTSRLHRPIAQHTGIVDVPLTVTFDTQGVSTPLARTVQGRPTVELHVEREQTSRYYKTIAQHAGVADVPLTLDFSTEGSVLAPSNKVYRALEPHSHKLAEPVSRLYQALEPVAPVAPPSLGIAIAGSTNQWSNVRQVPVEPPFKVELQSRPFFYIASAPPIYRVIYPGSTNQGFIFAEPVEPVVDYPATRLFKGSVATVFGVVDLPLTLDFAVGGVNVTRSLYPLACDAATLATVVCASDTLAVIADDAATLATVTPGTATLTTQTDDAATPNPVTCD